MLRPICDARRNSGVQRRAKTAAYPIVEAAGRSAGFVNDALPDGSQFLNQVEMELSDTPSGSKLNMITVRPFCC